MSQLELTLEALDHLMESIQKHQIGKLALKTEDFELEIRGGTKEVTVVPAAVQGVPGMGQLPAAYAPVPEAAPAEAAFKTEQPAEVEGTVVKSPIVGTFYAAAAPDKPAFAPVGKQVKAGDVLFIIESMKLMNEVQSELDGQVAEVYVENGQPVEYGQPILRLK